MTSLLPENSYCNLDALKRYLQSKNWSLTDSSNGCLTYVGPLDDLQRPIRAVLPSSTEYVDTPFLVAKVLNLLSVLEKRPVESVCQTIMDQTCDRFLPALVVGKIVELRDSKMGEDEIEESENISSDRMIIIAWEEEGCFIRAHLSPEEYKIACDAHKDGKTISIKGKPEKLGKYFILTAPTEFKICHS